MAIRRLLLPLTGTAAGEAALTTALLIARIWDAHVTALHVRVDSRDVAPLAGEGLSGAMIEEMMSATEKESSDRAHAVRAQSIRRGMFIDDGLWDDLLKLASEAHLPLQKETTQ